MPAGGNNSMPCTTRSATFGGRSQSRTQGADGNARTRRDQRRSDARVLQADIDLEETLIVGATRHEL